MIHILINNSKAKTDATYSFPVNGQQESVGLTSRSNTGDNTLYRISKAQLISPVDEYIDLSEGQIKDAKAQTQEDWTKKKKEGPPPYPSTFRIKYNRPARQGLLLIYPLNPAVLNSKTKEVKTLSPVPIIGLAISFPNIAHDKKVKYFVNQQFIIDYDYDDTDPDMSNEQD